MDLRAQLFRRGHTRSIGIVAIAVLLPVAAVLGLNSLLAAPSRSEAARVVYGELLAYEHLHGDPHVVFHHRDRIYFDHLKRDYKYLLTRQSPGWVLSGLWYYIPETDEPASVGVARCTGILGEECDKSTEIFGQINSAEITTLEVEYDEEWHRFTVESRGYAVRLNGFKDAPTGYRFLDGNGEVLHEAGALRPLIPGR